MSNAKYDLSYFDKFTYVIISCLILSNSIVNLGRERERKRENGGNLRYKHNLIIKGNCQKGYPSRVQVGTKKN